MTYVAEGIDSRAEVLISGWLKSPALNDSIVFYPKQNGAPMVPDPATAFATVYDPGAMILTARAAATIAGNSLVLTQQFATPQFYLAEDFFVLWEWQVGGIPYLDRQYFDVVLNKLNCLVDESDLLEEYPDLNDSLAAIGETGPQKFIKRGWSHLLDRIRTGGNRPSLIFEKARLINPGVQRSLFLICKALSRAPGDLWDERMKLHKKLYDELYAGLGTLKYDRNETATVEQDDKKNINRRPFHV